MSLTTITINSVEYQSYASVTEADEYLAVDPERGAAWATLDNDTKGAHLVAATRRLDMESYPGEKEDENQTTEWPRTNATCNGEPIPDGIIPQELEDATILLAGSIALDASAAAGGIAASNIKSAGAGSAKVEFFRPTSSNFSLATMQPTVFATVRCLLSGSQSSGAGYGLASGTGRCSPFDDKDAPGLTEGYP